MVRSLVLSVLLGLLVLASRAAAQPPDLSLKADGTANYQIILPDGTHTDGEDDADETDDDTRDRDAEGEDEDADADGPETTSAGGGGGVPCGAGLITLLPLMLTFAPAHRFRAPRRDRLGNAA